MANHAAALYGFCGAFFAELRAGGVRHAVVSPGYHSAPLTVSADRAGLDLTVQIDERSGGYFALGLAKALREPVALICTSGTAAANYLPAVIDASRSAVPLLILTADRPPELRGWGSNQTVDQVHLYGSNPRWFAELPVASEGDAAIARRFAARAVAESTSSPAGPVHLNFPLRRPLRPDETGPTTTLPERTITVSAGREVDGPDVAILAEAMTANERGVILAGAMAPGSIDPTDVLAVAARVGWPIVAEPVSQLRVADPITGAAVVSTGTHLARIPEFVSSYRPDVLVLTGATPPSRSLRDWVGSCGAERVFVVGDGPEWDDDSFSATDVIRSDAASVFRALKSMLRKVDRAGDWEDRWIEADLAASGAVDGALIDSGIFEGRVVTAVAGAIPDGVSLFVGNSMAVRDLDLFWPRRDGPIDIYSNRGASGIDGIVSTALGVAAGSKSPVVLLAGDLSFLHDLSGLLAAVRLGLPLIVVVVDNGGGGIFSLLPIADCGDHVRFNDLFLTPHGADLGAIATGLGLAHHRPGSSAGIQGALVGALESRAPAVIHLRVDPDESAALHRAVAVAASDAVAAIV